MITEESRYSPFDIYIDSHCVNILQGDAFKDAPAVRKQPEPRKKQKKIQNIISFTYFLHSTVHTICKYILGRLQSGVFSKSSSSANKTWLYCSTMKNSDVCIDEVK